MTEPEARFSELLNLLKARGFRLSTRRKELVRLIVSAEGHPSAAQIYARIKAAYPSMSHATVYKTLALLKEMNQVLEIDLRGDSHYDGNRPQPHPHLICTKCGKIIDADISLDPLALQALEKASGYTVVSPQINLYGLCPDCKADGS